MEKTLVGGKAFLRGGGISVWMKKFKKGLF